jgi:hypothetical protein
MSEISVTSYCKWKYEFPSEVKTDISFNSEIRIVTIFVNEWLNFSIVHATKP